MRSTGIITENACWTHSPTPGAFLHSNWYSDLSLIVKKKVKPAKPCIRCCSQYEDPHLRVRSDWVCFVNVIFLVAYCDWHKLYRKLPCPKALTGCGVQNSPEVRSGDALPSTVCIILIFIHLLFSPVTRKSPTHLFKNHPFALMFPIDCDFRTFARSDRTLSKNACANLPVVGNGTILRTLAWPCLADQRSI